MCYRIILFGIHDIYYLIDIMCFTICFWLFTILYYIVFYFMLLCYIHIILYVLYFMSYHIYHCFVCMCSCTYFWIHMDTYGYVWIHMYTNIYYIAVSTEDTHPVHDPPNPAGQCLSQAPSTSRSTRCRWQRSVDIWGWCEIGKWHCVRCGRAALTDYKCYLCEIHSAPSEEK